MPRLRDRAPEMPQRQSSRGPFQLRTSSSDSDPLHNRPTVDRSPKLGERRSPRGSADSVNQKKFGTRIADLESQLGQAQEELKKLKDQLVSAEAAKKEAQEKLEKKGKENVTMNGVVHNRPPPAPPTTEEVQGVDGKTSCVPDQSSYESSRETDVFEVPISTAPVESKIEPSDVPEQEENETRMVEKKCTEPSKSEIDKLALDMTLLNDEIHLLKTKLEEKDKELELLRSDNERLNKQVAEAAAEFAAAKAKEEETAVKMSQIGEELKESKENAANLKQELETLAAAKGELDAEMKTMRVQTDQWRKAADAAAAVLSGGIGMDGKRLADRCVSMDKHAADTAFEIGGGYHGSMGEYSDDELSSAKRKGSGIRKFGDLWKKKGHK
ncbi:hypothetical protein Syun_028391 [Stephania yunnanensis]|uniref:Interactor of constitutive active ROPs 4-like n=1 Tax=Stephania yunnanensis TaxID=152371 RepID=A0AAP0HS25_9MAGN